MFFLLSPENAHQFVIWLLEVIIKVPGGEWLIRRVWCIENPALEKNVSGLHFTNPVGLAAGFDKDAKHIRAMSALGFGSIEVGTVTPLPQPGNDRPRSFRLPKDEALINRMGFNNQGVDVMVARLKHIDRRKVVIGGNIGKNKSTPNEKAINDYETCFEKLFDYVDYFVVNVSSPNTPGLRSLQEKEPLTKLLSRLQELNHQHEHPKPVLLKIAPDLTFTQLDEIVEIILQTRLAGIIATNTTISRTGLLSSPKLIEECGPGGLSGKPLTHRSTEIIQYLSSRSMGQFSIIGVGGIHSAKDALEKIEAGAAIVQIYTGLIYEGPALIKKINRQIIREQK
ncbi:MAG TPA: quinone-dependent dihydroorotate dehydrogenase [Chitinophagales bacterium]|nr:quinone-dependent dihydroorotate dehydrogenase [Chitinophagales bacterium]